MKKLKKLFASLLICLATSSCAHVEIPDIAPGVTLPGNGTGFQRTTITDVEIETPAHIWKEKIKRGIILFSDDWAKLKKTLLKNCLSNQCKSTVGALDGLFYTIDDALNKIPSPK